MKRLGLVLALSLLASSAFAQQLNLGYWPAPGLGANTFTGLQTLTGGLTLSGARSAPTWTTSGIDLILSAKTLTDTTAATGTTASVYGSLFGADTIAATNASVVYTDAYGYDFEAPAAGTNVTLTRTHAARFGAGVEFNAAGVCSAPAITPAGNATSGFMFDSSGNIYTCVGGAAKFEWSGTAGLFEVASSSTTAAMGVGGVNGGSPGFFPIRSDLKAGIGADTAGDVSIITDNAGTATENARYGNNTTALNSASITTPNITTDTAIADATVCRATAGGRLYFGSGTIGICLGTSSARFKHGIADLNVGLTQIMALKPISYYLNADHGDPNHLLYGFTAEAMQPVIPALVGKDAQGKPNTADYLGLVPVLVKAVQEQQAEIEELKGEIKTLKAEGVVRASYQTGGSQ